ncbi:putative toxin-antitoxin system toxin component, PIN family [Phenylobacterium sp.]|uniref:PIN domain-containing protein n=1 Tax=Phenylobacterium sp. TaxID=1871053 RepID=UPI0025CE03EC|nr:PIN domain-containing protein [Phenylobacterium sp.]MBX3483563.1 PIN domain-containing protein [Phenylobacterium sp.]MCW5761376.1 PIN domain-containing protein [Phenylobacterium sp.]
MRVCLDLNVWVADILARRDGRSGSASQLITGAVRGVEPGVALQLVVSWGMLDRLEAVLTAQLRFPPSTARDLVDAIASYAEQGPSLTLGGVGVIPIHDREDRHVLETAWAGRADALVTQDFGGFLSADAEVLEDGRLARLSRGGHVLHLAHPFRFAAWLRGEAIAPLPLGE